jgi:catechol 2,3-dioxygenase-like lactoylglutathione lyase family enzyme
MNSTDSTTLVAPAMRFVPVSDLQRSISFYVYRLGFSQQELKEDYGMNAAAELALGPARVQLCPAKSFEPKILFFEAANIAEFREHLKTQGATPSALQRVNWIKMEMFEVRDPDGNTLWFGQSFHQPDQERPEPQVHAMLPHLPFNDVPAAVRYYCDVLGFSINYAQDDIGVMYRDKGTVLLIQRSAAHTGIGSCTAYIADADALFSELKSKGAKTLGPPVSRPWGLRDFTTADLEGNQITFAQPFE